MYNEILFYVGLGIAIVMGLVSIFLFWKFNIIHIIGDLFGFNERKAVKDIRSNTISNNRAKASNETTVLGAPQKTKQISFEPVEENEQTQLLSNTSDLYRFEIKIDEEYIHADISRFQHV